MWDPKRNWLDAFIICLLISAVCVTVYKTWMLGGIHEKLNHLKELQETRMQEHRTSWTDQEGLTHTVVTPRGVGEDDAAWAARHKASVDALKALFPPQ